jgi:hypothetical protein
MTAPRVAEILAALAAAGPARTWPDHLVEACRQATDVSGVGLALTDPTGTGGVVAATAGAAQQMEELQFTLGEGPCMDASRFGRTVLCSDLGDEGFHRWPAFAPGAVQAGVAAAFTFPLSTGAIALGVLDLYRTMPGELSVGQLAEALAFADAAIVVLLHLHQQSTADHGDSAVGGQPIIPPSPGSPVAATGDGLGSWAELADRRAVVHQAVGMISVQLDVDMTEALLRLRAHAYALGRSMPELATHVVARRLRFDHSEAGTTEGSGRTNPGDSPGGEPS